MDNRYLTSHPIPSLGGAHPVLIAKGVVINIESAVQGTIDNPVSHHAPLVLVSCTPAAWLNSSYEDDGRDPQILYIIEQEQTEKDLEEFMETFGDEVDNTCRIKIKSSSSNNSFYKPWISDNPRNYNPLQ